MLIMFVYFAIRSREVSDAARWVRKLGVLVLEFLNFKRVQGNWRNLISLVVGL